MFRIGEFAERIRRCISTVCRWEAGSRHAGHPPGSVSSMNPTYAARCSLASMSRPHGVWLLDESARRRRKDDLAWWVATVERFCVARKAVDEWAQDIGGGTNLRRKRFLAVMGDMDRGRVRTLVVAHKD